MDSLHKCMHRAIQLDRIRIVVKKTDIRFPKTGHNSPNHLAMTSLILIGSNEGKPFLFMVKRLTSPALMVVHSTWTLILTGFLSHGH